MFTVVEWPQMMPGCPHHLTTTCKCIVPGNTSDTIESRPGALDQSASTSNQLGPVRTWPFELAADCHEFSGAAVIILRGPALKMLAVSLFLRVVPFYSLGTPMAAFGITTAAETVGPGKTRL